ncbi:MAG: RNA-directed DNA polymerase [Acidobacteriaceae bacterium]|nr:RNA-directed DNA polymerase [Acidobacteriaceae bacterium]
MGTLAKVYDEDNIARAWRWIRSNPNRDFKGHFREFYERYSLADIALLADLRDRLTRGIYQPSESCKLYLPKKSGILRPYSLLSIEDQIVYQSFVNVIAEQLYPRIKSRYLIDTFGHLYAGKTSVWFYRKWSDGYIKFNQAAKDAFTRGLKFTASFDLTAYYDSIDHRVLKHFLLQIGCTIDFCDELTKLLSTWTATAHKVYHGHGIPQGPLASGLLSEVVLQHFDRNYGHSGKIKYLRYVDDIRLFARSELELRKMIVRLDLLSKDIGLFPQSGKIEIHEVKDIDAELKSISTPPESVIQQNVISQLRVHKRIIELSPSLKIHNETRFKYVLAYASPRSSQNLRLMKIFEARPDLSTPISEYFKKYRTLPKSVSDWVLREAKKDQLYSAVHSNLLSIAECRMPKSHSAKMNAVVKTIWSPGNPRMDLLAKTGAWSIRNGLLSLGQTTYGIRKKKNWWPQAILISSLNRNYYGDVYLAATLNECLRSDSTDAALAAAAQLAALNLSISLPVSQMNRKAALLLRHLGIINRTPQRECGIKLSMTSLLGAQVANVHWRIIFGNDYRRAEIQAIWCRAYSQTNITSFVNAMDVFNDWLMIRLYAHDSTIGTYAPGKIGSILNSTRLQAKYPLILVMVKNIHEHRYLSHLSHALIKKTGRPTKHIKFSYLTQAKRYMKAAFLELERKW